jgi:hypothetical protein
MALNRLPLLVVLSLVAVISGGAGALLGSCGPFTDVAADGFCSFVLEIFTLGITTGTSPTTYDPAANVSRLQMAAFLSRTVDGALKRASHRAALRQFWTPQNDSAVALTPFGIFSSPNFVKSDGQNVWVTFINQDSVARVRAPDGKLLDTWTGVPGATGILVAMGRAFVGGIDRSDPTGPGRLYRIDPTQPAGVVTTVASNLGYHPWGIAYDGSRIWTANNKGSTGNVSIVTPGASIPWSVTTVTGFGVPYGVLFDGADIWVTDQSANQLYRLDANGTIVQAVPVGGDPLAPVFDGTNIWVPNYIGNSVSVVRASSGTLLRTLTGNGLDGPAAAAFDGQRILVTNSPVAFGGSAVVSLWKAADLTALGSFSLGTGKAVGACSDGTTFWVAMNSPGRIARF